MTPENHAALRKPFDPKYIGKLPKGGAMLDFVGHATVTDRLLEIDPDWSWAPFATDDHGLPALDKAGDLWIHLTICGVTRIGVGDGITNKIRIGDAIRNAAMRFGVALELWCKGELENVDPNGGDTGVQGTVVPVRGVTAVSAPTPAPVPRAAVDDTIPGTDPAAVLRERVLAAMQLDKKAAVMEMGLIAEAVAKQKLSYAKTLSPAGESMTFGLLVDNALRFIMEQK